MGFKIPILSQMLFDRENPREGMLSLNVKPISSDYCGVNPGNLFQVVRLQVDNHRDYSESV